MTISFSPQNYTIPEGTPAVIMIVLDKPSPKNITITVTTMDITARGIIYIIVLSHKTQPLYDYVRACFRVPHHRTHSSIPHADPDDYTGSSFGVSIPAGAVKVTLNVTTLTDNFVEDDEYFMATLSLPAAPEAVVVGSLNMAFVTIADETRMLGS